MEGAKLSSRYFHFHCDYRPSILLCWVYYISWYWGCVSTFFLFSAFCHLFQSPVFSTAAPYALRPGV